MTAGPVNRAVLQSFYQNPGQIYSDTNTEGCMEVLAGQIDENWSYLYQYLYSLVNSGVLAPYPPYGIYRQAIMNGGFDVWQRGVSSTVDGYLADRWQCLNYADGGTLPTVTRSRQQFAPGGLDKAFYYYSLQFNGAGSSLGTNRYGFVGQGIENGTRYLCGAGKKVTITFWARSSIAGKRIGIVAIQGYGSGGSPSGNEILTSNNFTLTTTFTKYQLTIDTNTLAGKVFGSNNDDALFIQFYYTWGSGRRSWVGATTDETYGGAGSLDIAQIQVNAGDTAPPFQPRSYAEELALCQRYYEKSYSINAYPGAIDTNGESIFKAETTANLVGAVRFAAVKRAQPVVTIYNPQNGAVSKVAQWSSGSQIGNTVTAGRIATSGFSQINDSGTAFTAGVAYEIHWTAESEL